MKPVRKKIAAEADTEEAAASAKTDVGKRPVPSLFVNTARLLAAARSANHAHSGEVRTYGWTVTD